MAAKLRRIGKFYVFLRAIRAELFDEAFEAELAAAYQPRGVAPLPPALLAMVTLLQAYDQVGDAEAVVTAQMDQRWQLALGCLGASEAPFSQGALVKFRERMIAHDLDQKLLDRTVALAKQTGRFGWQALRAALDSSPLVGAGRVEDTWNLIGRALRTVATCAAKTLKVSRDDVLREAGITLLGTASLKAALGYRLGRSGGTSRRAGPLVGRGRSVGAVGDDPCARRRDAAGAGGVGRVAARVDARPGTRSHHGAAAHSARRRRRAHALVGRSGDAPWPQDADAALHRLQTPCDQTRRRRCDRRRGCPAGE